MANWPETATADLSKQLLAGRPVRNILRQIAHNTDQLVNKAWPKQLSDNYCLLATGGYGRAQLHPYSDIDLLILGPQASQDIEHINQFIQTLWDANLKVSHSVRTLDQCLEDIKHDLNLYTSLLEARMLAGPNIYQRLQANLAASNPWSQQSFLQAKISERQQRHEREQANLEPDIKNCPGGLRDWQHIAWLLQHFFPNRSLFYLLKRQIITRTELTCLGQDSDWLMACRLHLHIFTGKSSDRLLFDQQIKLASLYSFQGNAKQKAVEQFMQQFYQATTSLHTHAILIEQVLTELLNNSTNNKAINNDPKQTVTQLLQAWRADTQSPSVFAIRALITQVQTKSLTITTGMRQQFLQLLANSQQVHTDLKKLNDYGVLALLIPDWQHLCGQMQFDLFHLHTVDYHTLEVIKQAQMLCQGQSETSLADVAAIAQKLPAKRILYLAAFFHDIGKGTGVDHSIWGRDSARRFAKQFNLPDSETDCVCWLVANHLLMSLTAQKQDIHDPKVIARFAHKVNDIQMLNYLYALTVADIRGTNIKLWSSWVHQLLKQLYQATYQYLTGQTLSQTLASSPSDIAEEQLHSWPKSYRQHFSAQTIRWHQQSKKLPVIKSRNNPDTGQCELVVRLTNRPYIFANATNEIDILGLGIAEARMYLAQNKQILLHLILTGQDGQPLNNTNIAQEACKNISEALAVGQLPKRHRIREDTSTQPFAIKTEAACYWQNNTIHIDLVTADRRGLLADIAQVFAAYDCRASYLKIMTSAERVFDNFTLMPSGELPNLEQLQQDLIAACQHQKP